MANGPTRTPSQQINAMRSWYAMQEQGGTAVLECVDCDKRLEQHFNSLYYKTDDEVAKVFFARGWTVKPTRCPRCAKKAEGRDG